MQLPLPAASHDDSGHWQLWQLAPVAGNSALACHAVHVHLCSKRLVTTAHADIEYARLPASRQKRAFTMRPTFQKFLILSPILCMHVQVEMSWRNNGDLLANRTICSGNIPDCAASAAAAATGSIILYEGRDEIGDKASQFPAVCTQKAARKDWHNGVPQAAEAGSPHPC